MLISGIRQLPPRSGCKKKESQCVRQNATLTLSSSLMSTLGGEQMAPSVLAFCIGCLHTLKRQDGNNVNEPFIGAASIWSLGQALRQKLWPSRWWDSEPPRRKSKGSTVKCTSKRGYWAPIIWARADEGPWSGNLHFLGRGDALEVGYCQARRGSGAATASILQPSHPTESNHRTWVRNEDQHNQTFNEARDVHWKALEAAHLLEQNIERLSQAASRAKSAEFWCAYSCNNSRRRPQGRCPHSPSPLGLKSIWLSWTKRRCPLGRVPQETPRGRWLEKERWRRVISASTHPGARAEALPGSTNTNVGCEG